jgi:aminopeptidase N
LPIVRQLHAARRLQLAQPQPRTQFDLQLTAALIPVGFHRSDAAGYVFWSERVIELDAINPQVAARLARALGPLAKTSRALPTVPPKQPCERVAAKSDLSNDVREVITRALAE